MHKGVIDACNKRLTHRDADMLCSSMIINCEDSQNCMGTMSWSIGCIPMFIEEKVVATLSSAIPTAAKAARRSKTCSA